MHRYACRYCGTRWGGAPRLADPVLLDLARSERVVADKEIRTDGSTPVQLRWLNTLLDGVEDLLQEWQVSKFFTDFASEYGRTVGVDLKRGADSLELEYHPEGSTVSCWKLALDGSDGPHTAFTLAPGSPTATEVIAQAALFPDDRPQEAIILGWDPDKWDRWDPPYEDWVAGTGRGEILPGRWSVANRRNIAPGTEVFLLLQGSRHGIVGHGITMDWPVLDSHYTDPAKTTRYVPLRWDRLLPLDSHIPREVLESEVPAVRWRQIYSSGWPVPTEAVPGLRNLWAREVG